MRAPGGNWRRWAVVWFAALVAMTLGTWVFPARGAAVGRRQDLCAHKMVRLTRPLSLTGWQLETSITVPAELDLVRLCGGSAAWDGWTENTSKWLLGRYGMDLLNAQLPAGTRLWR